MVHLETQVEVRVLRIRYRCGGHGLYRWVEWRSHPDGQLYDVARDITERRLAEGVERVENAKLLAMIGGMEEGVVFANADGVIVEGETSSATL